MWKLTGELVSIDDYEHEYNYNCIVHVYAIGMIYDKSMLFIVDDTSQRRTYALVFAVTFWGFVRITCVTFT